MPLLIFLSIFVTLAPKRVTFVQRSPKMNTLRIIFAVLAIVLLIVSSLSTLNPHDVQSAILPLVCLSFGFVAFRSYELDEGGFPELAAPPRLLATRAPPRS
jgi:hypothetical protein